MNDANKMKLAKQVYKTLCNALDARNWKYGKEEEDLLVHFGVNSDDIPMNFVIFIDAERQLIRLMSPLPFRMSEDKRLEGAVATCAATYGMADGSFDYDVAEGKIVFRMTASFRESQIGEGLFQYLISCACAMVDKYNDRFLLISKGILSIADFINTDS